MPEIHFLYVAMILFTACSLTIVVVSLLTDPPEPEKVSEYTWNKKIYDDESGLLEQLPAYKNYRYQAILLLISIGAILAWFW